jgi:hypothetical protein
MESGDHDESLREEDVTRGDKLDDRVAEGEGLPVEDDDDDDGEAE